MVQRENILFCGSSLVLLTSCTNCMASFPAINRRKPAKFTQSNPVKKPLRGQIKSKNETSNSKIFIQHSTAPTDIKALLLAKSTATFLPLNLTNYVSFNWVALRHHVKHKSILRKSLTSHWHNIDSHDSHSCKGLAFGRDRSGTRH